MEIPKGMIKQLYFLEDEGKGLMSLCPFVYKATDIGYHKIIMISR
jgi:hypothetical protein